MNSKKCQGIKILKINNNKAEPSSSYVNIYIYYRTRLEILRKKKYNVKVAHL